MPTRPGNASQANTVYSTSAPGLEYAMGNPKRQSYSSGHSSQSSGSQSSRGNVRRSVLPMRQKEQLGLSSVQPWPLPERLSSRGIHEAYHSPRNIPVSGRISTPDTSAFGSPPANWQPPAKAVPPTPATRLPSKNCVITEASSFRQYKGFCSGAKEIVKGNSGVKQKQKPVHRTLSRVVAKCTGCSWELDYDQIELDKENRGMPLPSQKSVGFRSSMLTLLHREWYHDQTRCLFPPPFPPKEPPTSEESK